MQWKDAGASEDSEPEQNEHNEYDETRKEFWSALAVIAAYGGHLSKS